MPAEIIIRVATDPLIAVLTDHQQIPQNHQLQRVLQTHQHQHVSQIHQHQRVSQIHQHQHVNPILQCQLAHQQVHIVEVVAVVEAVVVEEALVEEVAEEDRKGAIRLLLPYCEIELYLTIE